MEIIRVHVSKNFIAKKMNGVLRLNTAIGAICSQQIRLMRT